MHQNEESRIVTIPLTEVTTNICNLGIALAPSNTLSIQGITAPFPIQIAARGIQVDGISLVAHIDVPQDHKNYFNRSDCTARASESGAVLTLTTSKHQRSVARLTSRTGVTPKSVSVTSLSADLMRITGAQES
jgi:superfamily II DNA/RNA helicase